VKLFAALLAVFFSVLFTAPCNDAPGRSTTHTTVSSKAAQTHADLCSPFCTCSCCGVQLAAADLRFYGFTPIFQARYSEITDSPREQFFNIIYGIWQPPKI